MQEGRHTAEKSKKRIRPAVIILVCIAVVAAAGFFVARHYLNLMNYDYSEAVEAEVPENEELLLNVDSSEKSDEILEYEEYAEENLDVVYDDSYVFTDDVFHIMLVGVDSREKGVMDRSRTDTMILVSVNRSQKRIVLTSFLRDSYVSIPGYGFERLNAAFQLGGADKLFDTIEKNYKIKAEHNYAAVDFYSFIDVVDAVGGIDVELTMEDSWSINGLIKPISEMEGVDPKQEYLPERTEGLIHLDGIQALCYARNRLIGNDLHRTARQREVITAVIKKASGLSLKELNALAEAVLPNITTNMEKTDILALISHAPEYLNYDVFSIRLPQDGAFSFKTINEMSVVCPYYEQCLPLWYETVFGTAAADS